MTKTIVLILQFFNGISGLLGGYMLINDPSGKTLDLHIEWLHGTPFNNFLIPGIVLFTLNGLGNIIGFILTLYHKKIGSVMAITFGAILMIWIISQISWIGYKNYLQPLYFSTGLLQIVFGYYFHKMVNSDG